MKIKIMFGEVEHGGDLEDCCLAVSRAGGIVESSDFNEDEEMGWVIAKCGDIDSARAIVRNIKDDDDICYDGVVEA